MNKCITIILQVGGQIKCRKDAVAFQLKHDAISLLLYGRDIGTVSEMEYQKVLSEIAK